MFRLCIENSVSICFDQLRDDRSLFGGLEIFWLWVIDKALPKTKAVQSKSHGLNKEAHDKSGRMSEQTGDRCEQECESDFHAVAVGLLGILGHLLRYETFLCSSGGFPKIIFWISSNISPHARFTCSFYKRLTCGSCVGHVR